MSKKITDFLKDEQGSIDQRAASDSARLAARLDRLNTPTVTAAPPPTPPERSLRVGLGPTDNSALRERLNATAGPQQPLRQQIVGAPPAAPALRERMNATAGPQQPVGERLRSTPPDTDGLRARLNANAGPQPDLRNRIAATDDGGAGLRERLNATSGPRQADGDRLRNLPQDNGAIARRQQELQGPQQQTPGERLRANAPDNGALRERLNATAGPQQTPGAKIRGAAMDSAGLRERLNATAGPQVPPGEALRRFAPDMSAVQERLSGLQGPQQPAGDKLRGYSPDTGAVRERLSGLQGPQQPAGEKLRGYSPDMGAVKERLSALQGPQQPAPGMTAGARAPLPPAAGGMVEKLRSMVGLGERTASAPRAPAAPSAAGNMARQVFGSGEQWAQTGGKIADAAGRAAGVAGKVIKPVAKVAGTVAKWAAAPIGAYETVKGLQTGDNQRAALGAADTIAGAALWTPAAPAAGTYLAVRGGQALANSALGERGREAVGGTVNEVVKGAGKLLGQDWGVDDQNYLNQRAAGDAARARAKPAAPAAKGAAPAAQQETPPAAQRKTAPAAPRQQVSAPASSAESSIAQAARRSMLAELDAQQAGPDAITKVVRNSDGSANTYYTGSGRQIAPPAAASDDDRKLLERVSVVPGQGQRYSTFEQDGKQYMTVEAGRDEVGNPILQGVSVDGAANFPYPNQADSMLQNYLQARTRADGLQGADRAAADAFEERELRRANIESQFPQQAAPPAAPAGAPVQGVPTHVSAFMQQYGPAAQRAAEQLGVDPRMVLAQWGMETGWGRSTIGTHNLGNIKAVGGQRGTAATDRMTGSRDNYLNFDTPEAFADHYTGLIGRRYGDAIGAGSDIGRFANALKAGGYAEDRDYVKKLQSAYAMLGRGQQAQAPVADPLAGAVEVIDGANSRMEVPGASGMRAMDVAAFDAYNDALQSNPQLAQRAVLTQGGPMVDGVSLPGPVMGGGEGAINSYLMNARQGQNHAVNPAAAALEKERIQADGKVREQQVANANKAYLIDVDSGQRDTLGAPIYIKQAVTADNRMLGPQQAQPAAAPPAGAIDALRKHSKDPSIKADFDRKYGRGAADRILNGK